MSIRSSPPSSSGTGAPISPVMTGHSSSTSVPTVVRRASSAGGSAVSQSHTLAYPAGVGRPSHRVAHLPLDVAARAIPPTHPPPPPPHAAPPRPPHPTHT